MTELWADAGMRTVFLAAVIFLALAVLGGVFERQAVRRNDDVVWYSDKKHRELHRHPLSDPSPAWGGAIGWGLVLLGLVVAVAIYCLAGEVTTRLLQDMVEQIR
ncbi:MAG: hypothetical protein D6706_21635 [Chloroflexi bacterium]|nr:MAG: hypothetical protein D6706_21635 [Chloroflexota bacterium]